MYFITAVWLLRPQGEDRRALSGPAGTSCRLSGTLSAGFGIENLPMRFLRVRNSGQVPSGGELEDSLPLPSPRPSKEKSEVARVHVSAGRQH